MKDYRHGSHTAFSRQKHIVWITKYRKKVLTGEIATFTGDIIRQECNKLQVDILTGLFSKDHVHIMVGMNPHVTIRSDVQRFSV
jgi:putative transposase